MIVTVTFKQSWLGFPKGSETKMTDINAQKLERRGIVRILDGEEIEEKKEGVVKAFKRPIRDKMVESSTQK